MKKQKLLDAVAKTSCEIEISLDPAGYNEVVLTAPQGKNFDGQHDEVFQFESDDVKASELYQKVYDFLSEAEPQECTEETCSSWEDGHCDFWDNTAK